MSIDGLEGVEIPYLSIMKSFLAKSEPKKKKIRKNRLTEIDPKTQKPCLKNGVRTDRAIEVLYMFENADVTPKQIEDMKITIENLRNRVKKLEDWQD